MGFHCSCQRGHCEGRHGFATTTSSLAIEVMAITKAMALLKSQTFTHACFLSDSMSMLRKTDNGLGPKVMVGVSEEIKANKN
uniref:Uncharacterized protein n=1 Tax=Arion vulgaris TaxID=1028688 RepID=A0A0B7AS34_9EUPU